MIRVLALLLATVTAASAQDPAQTPGVAIAMTIKRLCTTAWGRDQRHVTAAEKRRVFANYGLTGNDDDSQGCELDRHGRRYEIDHLIPRSLGGADVVPNLWPQCYSGPWHALLKDRLEVRVSKELCAGRLTKQQAHKLFTGDWRKAYRRFFGEP